MADQIALLKDILDKLDNAHRCAYIHADFHNGNILQDQQSYIADLRLAKKKDDNASESETYILGYHLEWELSGEVVSRDIDKSKELEKQKSIWQDPSKKVAKIFDSATRTRILETGAGELDDMTFGGEGPQPGRLSCTGGKGPMFRN
ncbi:hypothetical protein C2G38_2174387 [Gigaspora rosea]|uniref:Protein kinase domain-containing protein n=1 Tax=Gigaspora rosea TaxID=44941 RepID=A0A397VMM1_9GLOM|nr:hypothetical protein C2G38_2174387 [Gigaspora rosea]